MSFSSGYYKIRNVGFNTQYADLANGNIQPGTEIMGHEEDGTSAGINHRTFYLNVTDVVAHLGTLRNRTSGTYARINEEKGLVEGGAEQVLQFSTQTGNPNDHHYIIHPQNKDIVWLLKSDKDWTQISAVPAPEEHSELYQMKFWTLEPVHSM